MPLDLPAVVKGLTPGAVIAQVAGEYPNSRVKIAHRLPDVVDGAGDKRELRLISSIPRPHPLASPWDKEAITEVRRRLGRSQEGGKLTGAQKGRVLYLLLGQAPAAFLTYHVRDTGEIEVLGADSPLPDGGYYGIELLLIAARRVAQLFEANPDHLYWSTDRAYFEEIGRTHGFDDVPSPATGHGASKFQLEATF
ncbi:MAG TPA: hypothetical protein VGK62_03745 [Gaiellaceae bacterium]